MANNDRAVALKITIADLEPRSLEVETLKIMSGKNGDHRGNTHVLQLLDHFKVEGPNGTHDVIVTDVLVSMRVLRDLVQLDKKLASYHVVLGVAYLHQLGIIHGDLHADNIAFVVPALNDLTVKYWLDTADPPEATVVLQREYEPSTLSQQPKYLVEPMDMLEVVRPFVSKAGKEGFRTVITDFGSAFRASDPDPEPRAPIYIRPPESLFNETNTDPERHLRSEIWSLACTIHEIVFAGSVFYGAGTKAVLLRQMVECIGALPDHWYKLADPKPYLDTDVISQNMAAEDFWKHPCYNNRQELVSLLRSMLRYNPAARPCAKDLTVHTWFSDLQGSANSSDDINQSITV